MSADRLQAQLAFLLEIDRLKRILRRTSLVGGDRRCLSIAAASVLAKVTRDRLMQDLHRRFPGYGFDRHKGYGTELHRARIAELGPCLEHRKTFKGVKEYL